MQHLLKFNAMLNDESLHIAAQQLHDSRVKVLLEHNSSINYPGTFSYGG